MEQLTKDISIKHIINGVGGLSMGFCKIAFGGELGVHTHAPAEIYEIVEGIGRMTIGDEIRLVGPQTVIHIEPNQRHGIKNIGLHPLKFNWIFPTDTWEEIEYHYEE